MHNPQKARIYRPAKTAMQSGRGHTRYWILEYEPADKQADPMMGWMGSDNTLQQLRMRFPTMEAAVKFAEEEGIPYVVEQPHARKTFPKSYAENFSFHKIETYQLKKS